MARRNPPIVRWAFPIHLPADKQDFAAEGVRERMGTIVKTVGVFLGANRSLTTLLSAIMAFHPETTVLNHGFVRAFMDPSRNFLLDPRQSVLDAFADEAQTMALGGQRGDQGGHILHSHAFDDETLRQAYLDRYGWGAKPGATCLIWKDATRLTKFITANRIRLNAICGALPSLRFMMMVRNPVDITISSIKKGYSAALVGEERKDNFGDVFVHMIRLFAGFAPAAERNPAQCRFLFQDELLDREHLTGLSHFLGVAPDPAWLDDIARLIHLRPSYPIEPARRDKLKDIVAQLIPHEPTARRVADQIV